MSQLQLNGPNEPVDHYKEFYGRSTEQMPMLIADGRVPMSVNGLMQRNLEVSEKDASGMYKFSDPVRSAWMDNYFDTGDAIALHPNGNIKVVLDAQPLREMNSRSQLSNCALVLPDGMYEKLEGHEFTREQIKNYIDKWLARDEAKSNPSNEPSPQLDRHSLRTKENGYIPIGGHFLNSLPEFFASKEK